MPLKKSEHHVSQSLIGNRRFFRTRRFVVILCLLLVIPLIIQIRPTSATVIQVPGQYAKIKDAVNNAVTGDTIQVDPGVYYENRIIIESTITALSIIGADPETTIIDGMGNGTIFELDGTNVYITGFTIRNAGNDHTAIASEKPGPSASSDYHRIINNIITTSVYGISLGYSSRNTIVNNTFINNPLSAITMSTAANNNITGNIIKDSAYGIKLFNSATNTIAANDIMLTSYGIQTTGTSTGTIIKDNVIAARTAGIYSSSGTQTINHNTISEASAGIYLVGSSALSAIVDYNTIINSSYGIRLYYSTVTSTAHSITNNKIVYSEWAIETTYSNGNTYNANWLEENTYGVYMSFSSSNTFYQNNFVDNIMQAYAGTGSNTWSSGGVGNYWSDYTGIDANENGIGDTPYLVSPIGQDNYPLMDTWSEHDVSVENVTADASEVNVGSTINITVTVKNKGRIGASESFTVTAKYKTATIETKAVTNLAAGATENLTFHWNTAYVTPGNYTVNAEANTVTDELNINNNSHNNGEVEIKEPVVGDIDLDGTVGLDDLVLLMEAYGSTTDSPNWNPDADLNKDEKVDALDLCLLGKNFGKTA